MKPSKKFWIGLIILALSLGGLAVAYAIFRSWRNQKAVVQSETSEQPDNEIEVEGNREHDLSEVYKLVSEVVNERYPEVDNKERIRLLSAQLITDAELNDSPLESMNPYGLKHPSFRETTSKGEVDGYASYASLQDCILDRLMYDEYNKVSYDGVTHVSFLKKLNELKYFSEPFISYKNQFNAALNELTAELAKG